MKDELLFENNFFVSKSIKQIDSSVGYTEDVEQKLVKNLIDANRDKSKKYLSKNLKEKMKLKKRKKEQELKKKRKHEK